MIGSFKKKNDLPDYLSHYGMYRAPFSSAIEDDMYYADPTRQQRLDILLHLTQNTNELLLVNGEEGTGKSTFINQFRKNAAEHWKLCFIEGHKMMSEEQFLERVYMGFGIAHASVHKGTMLSNLRKRLDTMLTQAIPVILVIDDAHLFPTKVLSLVLDIASIRNTKSGSSVRVILCSEPQIKILLAEPALDDNHNLIIRKIDLPPLDQEHTGKYLHHRLSMAGMIVEQFLTEATVKKIFKKSGGIPQQINEAADKLLFETTPIIRRDSNIQSADKPSGLKYLLITIIISLATGYALYNYIYEKRQATPYSTTDHEIKSETSTPLILPPENTDAEDADQVIPETQASTNDDITDPMQALKEELADKVVPANETKTEQQTPPNIALPQLNQTKQKVKPELDSELKPELNPELKDNDWALKQNPAHFTIQLVAGRKKDTITNFIKKYNLDGEQLIYFSSMRNGKVWHNLAIDIYPNRAAANQASKKLPASLKKIKPWIRSLGTVQSEIKKLP